MTGHSKSAEVTTTPFFPQGISGELFIYHRTLRIETSGWALVVEFY
jgi:hypothetical protein